MPLRACSESLCGPSSGSYKYCTPIFRFTKSTQHRPYVGSTVLLWFAVFQARYTLLRQQLTSRHELGGSQQIEVERMSRCVEAEGIYARASLVCTSFRPIPRTHIELVLDTRTATTKLLLQTAQALAVLDSSLSNCRVKKSARGSTPHPFLRTCQIGTRRA